MSTDDIYRQQLRNIEDFAFDKNVSAVFEDMIDRSVPGYRTLIANIGPIAKYFLQSDTNCYDLGCSHGAATLSIYNAISDRSIQFFGNRQCAGNDRKMHAEYFHAASVCFYPDTT